jgi:hypothetical protein
VRQGDRKTVGYAESGDPVVVWGSTVSRSLIDVLYTVTLLREGHQVRPSPMHRSGDSTERLMLTALHPRRVRTRVDRQAPSNAGIAAAPGRTAPGRSPLSTRSSSRTNSRSLRGTRERTKAEDAPVRAWLSCELDRLQHAARIARSFRTGVRWMGWSCAFFDCMSRTTFR